MSDRYMYTPAAGSPPPGRVGSFEATVLAIAASNIVEGMTDVSDVADFVGVPLDEYKAWWDSFVRPLLQDADAQDLMAEYLELSALLVMIWGARGDEDQADPHLTFRDISVAFAINSPDEWAARLPEVEPEKCPEVYAMFESAVMAHHKLEARWVEIVEEDPEWAN